MSYETKFENGENITQYLAVAYAEGFEESSHIDKVKAWSYLIGTRIAYTLQGWFGRNATTMIEEGYFNSDGTVNWDNIENDG
jgi:hypothetical protein